MKKSILTNDEKLRVVELYNDRQSASDISKLLGIPSHTIFWLLKKQGVETRLRKHSFNESFFDCIDSEEKAYFLGFLYADGCVTAAGRHSWRTVLSLQERDLEILQKLSKAIDYTGPIIFKKAQVGSVIRGKVINSGNQFTLALNSKKVGERLCELGCTPAKSHTLTFPKWMPENLLPHFVRGYIDGDGWITSTTYNISNVGAIGSETFINQLREILISQCSVTCGIARNKSMFNAVVAGRDQVSTVLAWLYKDATIYLERKKRKAEEVLIPVCYEGKVHGENCYMSILAESQVREIQRLLLSKESMISVAHKFNVGKSTIAHIALGESWSKVTGWRNSYNLSHALGRENNLKLDESMVKEVVGLFSAGLSNGVIAERFNVKAEQIRRIRTGERWAQVTGITKQGN